MTTNAEFQMPNARPRASVLLGLVLLIAVVALALAPGASLAADPTLPKDMKAYNDCPYYVIYSDLDLDGVREAVVRMTAMAEEYHQRTQGFSGTINKKLPFYLFKSAADYYIAGGKQGSAGIYDGKRLMAIAGDTTGAKTWHTVQHEGFHQFAHAVIRGDLPAWVNEGLAEYFGEGLYTGDLFVVGVLPPGRLARLKQELDGGKFKPMREIMTMTGKTWIGELSILNYDQAWSMIHFLVHGDNGKYVGAMTGFVRDIGSGTSYENAWLKNFGKDIDGFEKKWREYWKALSADPTAELYAKATVATMTSYFARAYSQKQTFAAPEEFFKAGQDGQLKSHREDWLPPSLLKDALTKTAQAGQWSIETPQGKLPRLVCQLADGAKLVGAFALNGPRVGHVTVDLVAKEEPKPEPGKPVRPATRPGDPGVPASRPKPPEPAPPQPPPTTPPGAADSLTQSINLAKAYIAMRSFDKAREVLQEALKQNPNSPQAAEARQLLEQLNK